MNILIPQEENALIQQGIAEGNQQSFRQLFDRYAHRLIAFSKAILNSREMAVEIVDDIFVKLWKNRQQVGNILHISVNTVDAQMVIAVRRISEQMKGHLLFS